jgi:hypothetical protein
MGGLGAFEWSRKIWGLAEVEGKLESRVRECASWL